MPTTIELRGSRASNLSNQGSGQVVLTFAVTGQANPFLAPFEPGIPLLGDRLVDYPGFTGPQAPYLQFTCTDIAPRRMDDSHDSVLVDATYTVPSFGGTTPDDGRHTETWDLTAGRERIYADIDGKPIGKDFTGVDVFVSQCRVTMTYLVTNANVQSYGISAYEATGHLNANTWRGQPPRSWLYLGPTLETLQRGVFRVSHSCALATLGPYPAWWDMAGASGHDYFYIEPVRTGNNLIMRGESGEYIVGGTAPASFRPHVRRIYRSVNFNSIVPGGLPSSPPS